MEQLSDIVGDRGDDARFLGINCATFVGIQVAGLPGAIATTLGVMTPSLTVCMLACHFMVKFRQNRFLQNALYGVCPVCIGMILAVAVPLGQANYFLNGAPLWPAVVIGAAAGALLLAKRSIPTVILAGRCSALCWSDNDKEAGYENRGAGRIYRKPRRPELGGPGGTRAS